MNRALGYRSRSQLSHFCSGTTPIPVEQAARLAIELDMDEAAFVTAVLRQPHPEMAAEAFHPPEIPDDLVRRIRAGIIDEDSATVAQYAKNVRQTLSRPAMKLSSAA